MLKSIMLALCCFIAFQIRAETELKGSPNELAQFLSGVPKTALVVGEGKVKAPADQAVITLKITTSNKSLQTALRLNQELRGKLVTYVANQGLPSDRVQSSKFSSTPKFGWSSERAKSYEVENIVKITVRDEKEFQTVGGAVDSWPEIQYQGIELEHTDTEAAKQQAVAKACDNATERKKIYEDKFGVRLVPKAISENTAMLNINQPQKTNLAMGFNSVLTGGSQPALLTRLPAADENGDVEESNLPFGELTFSARVVVEYSVETK